MTTQNTLEAFAENLGQDVLALAESYDEGLMLADSFTQTIFDMLSEAGEFEDPLVCYHRSRGMEVSGYGIDEDEGRLDLFLSIHTNTVPPSTVLRQQVAVAFRRLRQFLEWCLGGDYIELEESSPVYDMAAHIHSMRGDITQARLYVLTDGRTTVETLPLDRLGDIPVTSSLWDIVRLHRISLAGQQRERISINFRERFGQPLPCLVADSLGDEYRAFLMLIPGHMLREIYADFGPRLLERNVRSFLQARGKVNRAIRDTISKEPERFLAYNNGITMTAEAVELSHTPDGSAITRLEGLQIVNGGQTTASMLATERGRADLSQVHVAAKLIDIESGTDHDELVRNVSRYANSQNSISGADFSANDPFHVEIERLSRTLWTPSAAGVQRQTKWFYERARGQYQDARASQTTLARRRMFLSENPTKQKFTKTDLAKFENTWEQLPHMVSLGAQKNFSDYMIRMSERDQMVVNTPYFERLIAKAILFRSAERIVQQQNLGGYRANIVTYTLSLLSHATSQRIDLQSIWREQELSENLRIAIADLSHEVYRIIANPPGGRNVTEWCKSERCWEQVRSQASREAVERISGELMGLSSTREEQKRALADLPSDFMENLKRVVDVGPARWRMLADWAGETESIDPHQRQLVLRIGRAIDRGREISAPDAERAVMILDQVTALGFEI